MRKSDAVLLDKLTPLADLPKGGRVFVACSGGRDSLSLAYACYLLYQAGKLSVLPTLLHVHHGMQRANDDWAKGVADWAFGLGFICQVLYVKLDKFNETSARTARYQALASVMNDNDVLLLAHHAHDQAETVLMRLINGAGVDGLSGIRAWQDKCVDGKTLRLHRPWLNVSRDEISGFAYRHALPFVDDPTNTTGDNARSFIRTQILPQLKQLNPQAVQNIARSSANLASVADSIAQDISHELAKCVLCDTPYQSVLGIDKLLTYDKAYRSLIIRTWLQGKEILPPNKRTTDDVAALSERADNDHKTELFWQADKTGYVVCRYGVYLYRYPLPVWQWLQNPSRISPTWRNGAWYLGDLDNQQLYFIGADKPIPLARTDSVPVPIYGKQRLLSGKKLYQTLKIPPWLRASLWQVVRDDVIVAVMGVGHEWQLSTLGLSFKGVEVI